MRLNLVSVDTALNVGPRNDDQLCVTAVGSRGFGSRCAITCPAIETGKYIGAANTFKTVRRDTNDMFRQLTVLLRTIREHQKRTRGRHENPYEK